MNPCHHAILCKLKDLGRALASLYPSNCCPTMSVHRYTNVSVICFIGTEHMHSLHCNDDATDPAKWSWLLLTACISRLCPDSAVAITCCCVTMQVVISSCNVTRSDPTWSNQSKQHSAGIPSLICLYVKAQSSRIVPASNCTDNVLTTVAFCSTCACPMHISYFTSTMFELSYITADSCQSIPRSCLSVYFSSIAVLVLVSANL